MKNGRLAKKKCGGAKKCGKKKNVKQKWLIRNLKNEVKKEGYKVNEE